MFKKNKYDMPFCGLSLKLYPTGKKSPSYEFSALASKAKFTCSLTKRKYSLSQVNDWFLTPEVQKYHNAGYVLKYMTKTQEPQNPNKYENQLEEIFCLVMIKPRPQQPNVDGMKPISQSMPRYKEVSMTQAQPSAPEHAVSVEKIEDMDDDLPPF